MRRTSGLSPEVGFHDLDYILCGFLRRFRVPGHMIPNVIFHQFAHQAVDRASRGRQALKHVGTLLIFVQSTQNAFELTDDFLGPVH